MTVASIIAGCNSTALATLGASWKGLAFVFDVTQNNLRFGKKAVGSRPLDGYPAETVNRTFTTDHRMELIFCDVWTRRESDDELMTCMTTLFDAADRVATAFVHTKLGLPTLVLDVSAPTYTVPEVHDKQKLIVVRMQVTVKYRTQL